MNIQDFIPFDVQPETLITLAAGGAAFITVYAVWQALLVRDPMAGRIKGLRQHRDRLRAGMAGARRHELRRANTVVVMRGVVSRFKLLRTTQAEKMVDKLAQAGWRSKDALIAYLFFKLCMPFIVGGVALAWLYIVEPFGLQPQMRLFVSLGLVLAGAYAPDLYVRNATDRRRKALQRGLPDALDLLVICTEAGLALDAALTRVSREMAKSSPEVADEFGLTSVELGFLPNRRQALSNLARRADTPAIRGVVNTLIQTERYGTPLAQSLRVLAAEFRNERMMKAEEKAAKLPAIMTIPLIVFILPTLFIVLLGPAIVKTLDGLRGAGFM